MPGFARFSFVALLSAMLTTPASQSQSTKEPGTPMIVHVSPGESIQAAVETVSASGGGVVQLTAGVHPLHDSIWLRSGITLAGQGPATELRAAEGLTDVAIGTKESEIDNVTLRDFQLVGPGELEQMKQLLSREAAAQAPNIMGIFMAFATDAGKHVRLQRLRVTRWTRMGVHLKGITGLRIEGCDIDCSSAHNSLYHNVYLRRTKQVNVRHNTFRNSPVGNGFQASFSEQVLIEHNHSLDNAGHGIRVAASTDVKIQNNTVRANQGQAGIWLNSEKGRPCRNIIVSDNSVLNNAHSGLAVRNTNHCLVENNIILHNGTDVTFRNARDTLLRRNRFRTTSEEKKNSVTFEENTTTD